MRRASRLVGAATLMALAGCTTATRFIKRELERDIEEQALVRSACELYQVNARDGSPRISAFIGDDRNALMRITTSIWGGARPAGLAPWQALLTDLKQLHTDLEASETKTKQTLALRLGELRASLTGAVTWWGEASKVIEGQIEKFYDGGMLQEMNACARQAFKARNINDGLECTFNSGRKILAEMQDGQTLTTLESLREGLGVHVEDILVKSQKFEDALKEYIQSGGPMTVALDSITPRAMAFGGILRDGDLHLQALGRASSRDVAPLSALADVGKMLIDTQSDRIVDLSLLLLAKSIEKLQDLVDKVDASAYGLVSANLTLALRIKGVRRGMCTLASVIRRDMLAAGINEHSFGARVCYATTTNRNDYPNSELMTEFLSAFVRSSSETGCEDTKHEGSRLDPPPDLRARREGPGFTAGSTFRKLGEDTPTLARANWSSRVQLAQNHLDRARTTRSALREDMMPLLNEAPPMLHAAFLAAEITEPVDPKQTEAERLAVLVNKILSLSPSRDVATVLCRDRTTTYVLSGDGIGRPPPAACAELGEPQQPDFTVLVSALNKISDEACELKARADRLATVRSFCSSINAARDSKETAQCFEAGYHAVLSISERDLAELTFLPMSVGKNLGVVKESARILASRLVDELRQQQQQQQHSRLSHLGFQGRASPTQVVERNTNDLVISALAGEIVADLKDCKQVVKKVQELLKGAKNSIFTKVELDSRLCDEHKDLFASWPPIRDEEICDFTAQLVRLMEGKSKLDSSKSRTKRPPSLCKKGDGGADARLEAFKLARDAASWGIPVSLPKESWQASAIGSDSGKNWVKRAITDYPWDKVGNPVLAVLRASGAYKTLHDVEGSLCGSVGICEIHGLTAESPENADHGSWQSFSIVVSADDPIPTCRSATPGSSP